MNFASSPPSSSCSTCASSSTNLLQQHGSDHPQEDDSHNQRLLQLEESLADRHTDTQQRIDWNTLLAYVGAGVGVLSFVLAVVTLVIMLVDRQRLKECLTRSSRENMSGVLL